MRLRFWARPNEAKDSAGPDRRADDAEQHGGQGYAADAPLSDPHEDRLGRAPFAQRVAGLIADRKDPKSLVVGIYGEWGDGKSSVLNFIEFYLRDHEDVVLVPFNPWLVDDERAMLPTFLSELAGSLGRAIPKRREQIAGSLARFAGYLAPLDPRIASLQRVSERAAAPTLAEQKRRLTEILEQEGKRVVVAVDDIDRLDNREIQSLFRLIKLVADFDHTTYLLACDQTIVGKALGERYGGNDRDGLSFLDKIVQIPLLLPPPDGNTLQRLALGRLEEELRRNDIDLSNEQAQEFSRRFVIGLEARVRTPRAAVRLGNSVAFALPLLKGEANPVDVLTIEALKVLYPTVHAAVAENAEVFLGSRTTSRGPDPALTARAQTLLRDATTGFTDRERAAVEALLKDTFPALRTVLGENISFDYVRGGWAAQQRVASPDYFDRYFSHLVPLSQVSDAWLTDLIASLPTTPADNVQRALVEQVEGGRGESLITKLRAREDQLSSDDARKLAEGIASLGDVLARPEVLFSFSTPYSQAAILIRHLLQRVPPAERLDGALSILSRAPLGFAAEIWRWLRPGKDDEPDDRVLTGDDEPPIAKLLLARIREAAEAGPLYLTHPRDATLLLFLWARYGSREETEAHLRASFEKSPGSVVDFLECYVPIAWSMDTGIGHRSDFSRDMYDQLKLVINPDAIDGALIAVVGDVGRPGEYPRSVGDLTPRLLAEQFRFLHLSADAPASESEGSE
ncbi:MAG TPA: P-loop NTPase fold protein [Candidatus Limnocylindrales bacterium]|jgi:hypothetical protein|nr:P-loop NTPase fold protein [Candidatus Limnocylindrales bacterium]